MKNIVLVCFLIICSNFLFAQTSQLPPSQVNFEDYLSLSKEVFQYRKDRVVHIKEWLKMRKKTGTIILDTRSKAMYNAKHIKGAIHLNFSDFNMGSLRFHIPNKKTRILIYCNNNIRNENQFFVTKGYVPTLPKAKKRMLALNVPTFINLYGYGYKNVYELADLVDINSNMLEFEGTSVSTK